MSDFRAVDALTGSIAERPSKFFAALTEADLVNETIKCLREERDRALARVDELEDIADELLDKLSAARTERDQARAERDSWRARASVGAL